MILKRKFTTLEKILIGFVLFLFVSSVFGGKQPKSEPETLSVAATTSPEPSPTSTPTTKTFKVTKVIDGDTIEVEASGSTKLVRFIGINAPEKNACLYEQSTQRMNELLETQEIELIADASQGEFDKYQRLLRYVQLNGSDAGQTLISEGLAKEYTYKKKYDRQAVYQEAESGAKNQQRGIWNPTACSTPTPRPTTPTPKPAKPRPATPKPTAGPTSTPLQSNLGGQYACNCSKTCPNLSCDEAQYQLNVCGCSRRDGDGDGIACDSQCQ